MIIKKLSIIIPSYNEGSTIAEVIKRVKKVNLGPIKKEIIVVNDGSTDQTAKVLAKLKVKSDLLANATHQALQAGKLIVLTHKVNLGKGATVKSALKKVSGDVVVIQDADLEYNPNEYKLLLQPIIEGKADVVYGSRFVSTQARRILYFWHSLGNNFLTTLSNIFTNLNLTDMETCYKMFTSDVASKLNIQENRFGFDPEFTSKIAKNKFKIYEVGVSYSGRDYKEGKKIKWIDGLTVLWCIIKYNLLSND